VAEPSLNSKLLCYKPLRIYRKGLILLFIWAFFGAIDKIIPNDEGTGLALMTENETVLREVACKQSL
jgi:hypothetical protein